MARADRDRAAMQAAYRLGGREAVREMLAPGVEVVCPMCEGGLVEAFLEDADGSRRSPVKMICQLCLGLGGLQRIVATDVHADATAVRTVETDTLIQVRAIGAGPVRVSRGT